MRRDTWEIMTDHCNVSAGKFAKFDADRLLR